MPRLHAAKAFMNTWKYDQKLGLDSGVDIIIEPDELKTELTKLGFNRIDQASEGCLYAADPIEASNRAFFQGEYMGDLGVYEIIACKG